MEITAMISQVLPAQGGTSQSGKQWQKQTFVVRSSGEFPKDVAFIIFNDKVQQLAAILVPGTTVTVKFEPESREYNGRWYTDLRAYSVTYPQTQPAQQPAQQYQQPTPQQAAQAYQPQQPGGGTPYQQAQAVYSGQPIQQPQPQAPQAPTIEPLPF